MTTGILPTVQPTILGDFAYEALKKHFKKSIKHEAEVLQDQDPEALHQMRVGMRRLRTALQVFQFTLELPDRDLEHQIGKIAHVLGAVRDLDVLGAELESHRQTELPKAEKKQLDIVLKHLYQERKQRFAKLEKTLDSKKYHGLQTLFQDWLADPQYRPTAQLPILTVLPDLLLPLISELLLHPGWLVGMTVQSGAIAPPIVTDADSTQFTTQLGDLLAQDGHLLHDLRKQMKRVRYQTEFFTEFYPASFAAHVEDFKQLQEVLGQLQDSAVLQEFLTEVLNAPPAKACPQLTEQLHRKTAIAWREWQTRQPRYLNPEFRMTLRSSLLAVKTTRFDSNN